MDALEEQTLWTRLRRLEWRLRVMELVWILTVLLAVLFGPWTPRAATQPQLVRTASLEIIDAMGRIRATLDAVNSKPSLWLYGDDGRRRAGLGVGSGNAPEFLLADNQGRPRISLRAGYERAAEIRISDARGHTRLGLWIGYDEEPGIWLLDELGRPCIGMKGLTGGVPRLWLFEQCTGRVTFSAP